MLVFVMVNRLDHLMLVFWSKLSQLQLVLLIHMMVLRVSMKCIMRIVRMIIPDHSGFLHLDVFLCASGSAYSIQKLGKLAISPPSRNFVQFDHAEFIQLEGAKLVELSIGIGITNLSEHIGLYYWS